jgi:transcriptional regulator with XRE-family HTH domain
VLYGKDFAKKFLKARSRTRYDQKDAAAALEVSPSFLSKVEKGKKSPSVDLIIKAAEVYEVHPGFFFDNQEEIDLESMYSAKNLGFIKDLETMTDQELQEKYRMQLDGKDLSSRELKGFIAYVRSLRSMDEES